MKHSHTITNILIWVPIIGIIILILEIIKNILWPNLNNWYDRHSEITCMINGFWIGLSSTILINIIIDIII